MFKMGSCENDLFSDMKRNLIKNQTNEKLGLTKLAKAADLLNGAAAIFDKAGMFAEADEITEILGGMKYAQDIRPTSLVVDQALQQPGEKPGAIETGTLTGQQASAMMTKAVDMLKHANRLLSGATHVRENFVSSLVSKANLLYMQARPMSSRALTQQYEALSNAVNAKLNGKTASLELGMKYELEKQASGKDASELAQAGEYLHSALDIFERTGLQKQADQIVALMQKIAEADNTLTTEGETFDSSSADDELCVADEGIETFEDD